MYFNTSKRFDSCGIRCKVTASYATQILHRWKIQCTDCTQFDWFVVPSFITVVNMKILC